LVAAPELLWNANWSKGQGQGDLLRDLAAAAERCDFDEVELRYLGAARALAPDDVQTLRSLARALTRQGYFEDAVGPWFAVLALVPDDAEAAQATEDLRGAGELTSVEGQLAQEHAAAGGDLVILERREQARLRHSEERMAIAARRAKHDPHPKAQTLVARLAGEHERFAIEILNLRVERLPEAVELRLELARRLKGISNFSGAVQRLEEALRLAESRPEAESAAELTTATLIELGECWQHLRQFAKALDYYEQAVAKSAAAKMAGEPGRGEGWKLAHYRSGVLAAALGKIDLATQRLAAIVSADKTYKDAAERLDRLPRN
jgi:tetratricopeptide (TPR) repeat protein